MTLARATLWALLMLLCVSTGFSASPANAHSQSYGYLDVARDATSLKGQLALALRDLDTLFEVDRDGDGKITWGEVRSREREIAGGALEKISIVTKSGACSLGAQDVMTDTRGGETYIVMPFDGTCPDSAGEMRVTYDLMFNVDAQHRALVTVESQAGTQNFVLSPETPGFVVTSEDSGWLSQFLTFTRHGMHHIWAGYDHILFLITLLLGTAVHMRSAAIGTALFEAAKVVTAFTLSHTLTLGLAAVGILRIPVAISESLIAVTIVLAAVNNIWPILTRRTWLIALIFGLIHGVGFANVLAEMNLARDSLLVSLLAFNVGVEVGQLAIVLAAFPLILLATRLQRAMVLATTANLAVSAVGMVWFLNRAFGTNLLGF